MTDIAPAPGVLKSLWSFLRRNLPRSGRRPPAAEIGGSVRDLTGPVTLWGPVALLVVKVLADRLSRSDDTRARQLDEEAWGHVAGGDVAAAVAVFRQMLSLDPPVDQKAVLLIAIGSCLLQESRAEEAEGHFAEAQLLSQNANGELPPAVARAMRGMVALRSGRHDEGRQLLTAAWSRLDEAVDQQPSVLAARAVLTTLSGLAALEEFSSGGFVERGGSAEAGLQDCVDEAVHQFGETIKLAESLSSDELRMVGFLGRGITWWLRFDLDSMARDLEQALTIAQRIGHGAVEGLVYALIAPVRELLGDGDDALDLYQKAELIFVAQRNEAAAALMRENVGRLRQHGGGPRRSDRTHEAAHRGRQGRDGGKARGG